MPIFCALRRPLRSNNQALRLRCRAYIKQPQSRHAKEPDPFRTPYRATGAISFAQEP